MPGESIADRPRPELDPLGMLAGGFRLFPSLELSAKRDSNIFAGNDSEVADWVFGLAPALGVESDWTRHSLDIIATSYVARYQDNQQEDHSDVAVGADVGLDVTPASALRFSARYESDHEDRFSPDDVLGIEPTHYALTRFSTAYTRRSGRVSLHVGARQASLDYDDVAGASGVINNDDRDRTETTYSFRTGYEVRPGIDLLLRADVSTHDYDDDRDDNGVDRSADSTTIAAGVRGALTGALYAEAFAGNVEHNYDDPALDAIDSPWYEARLVWNVSGLTTLAIEGSRDIRETTLNLASGYTATRLGVTVDHELLRNLLLHAGAHRQTDEYSGIVRDDDNFGISLGARYLVNRTFQLGLEFRQLDRDSSVAAGVPDDYMIRTILFTIRSQR